MAGLQQARVDSLPKSIHVIWEQCASHTKRVCRWIQRVSCQSGTQSNGYALYYLTHCQNFGCMLTAPTASPLVLTAPLGPQTQTCMWLLYISPSMSTGISNSLSLQPNSWSLTFPNQSQKYKTRNNRPSFWVPYLSEWHPHFSYLWSQKPGSHSRFFPLPSLPYSVNHQINSMGITGTFWAPNQCQVLLAARVSHKEERYAPIQEKETKCLDQMWWWR